MKQVKEVEVVKAAAEAAAKVVEIAAAAAAATVSKAAETAIDNIKAQNGQKSNGDIVEIVGSVTKAITVISESTKQNADTSTAIKDMIAAQNVANTKGFEDLKGKNDVLSGKMDGLRLLFTYVIVPLMSIITALVGIKMIFKLP